MNRSVIRAAAPLPCTLVVCRGCCCGNPRKHPGTDHARQLDRLRAGAAEHGFHVRTTDCLGPCDQANVIVVQPSGAGRRAGARAVWIGFATDDDCTDDLVAWAAAGGPGVAEPPAALDLQRIRPPREARTRARR
ncbi:(2Fe-2S) ferredoxin domain-containing protein [Streptomyces antnestii]|uniref:(2Fe-2S) ferredoxin domain-containing protein n=1 Tax=Streptomyces antnestii TaxID=2494256 RepID=A0A3S2YZI1_9ACTN|nr:(2Fe-2S) ferredoxin domain-containing protein [Streptomyces sp. San01]RVU23216.1 (2Fe-2S) ferredoxin domain-containing protein [Streptomyces sp. San01]